MIGKINIEGTAQFSAPSLKCICSKCGKESDENSTLLIEFKQCKIIYLCSNKKCKNMNEISLNVAPDPYPKMRVGR